MAAEDADRLDPMLLPHSQDAFETPVTYTVFDANVDFHYIISEKDVAIPPMVQQKIASAIPNCKVRYIAAGHSAFLSATNQFVELILQIVVETSGVATLQIHDTEFLGSGAQVS